MNLPDISKIVHVGILQTMVIDRDAEIAELREALSRVSAGLAMAYVCVEKSRNDEALLHIGHHEAVANKALSKHEAAHG
jgi:3-hydroxy-3-methylglutaryl CoA synthase